MICHLQLDMPESFSHKLTVARIIHIVGEKDRILIFRAKRVEQSKPLNEGGRDLRERYLGIDGNLGQHHPGLYAVERKYIEAVGKFFEMFFPQCQSGGIGMSAEVFQNVAARLNGLLHIEAGH